MVHPAHVVPTALDRRSPPRRRGPRRPRDPRDFRARIVTRVGDVSSASLERGVVHGGREVLKWGTARGGLRCCFRRSLPGLFAGNTRVGAAPRWGTSRRTGRREAASADPHRCDIAPDPSRLACRTRASIRVHPCDGRAPHPFNVRHSLTRPVPLSPIRSSGRADGVHELRLRLQLPEVAVLGVRRQRRRRRRRRRGRRRMGRSPRGERRRRRAGAPPSEAAGPRTSPAAPSWTSPRCSRSSASTRAEIVRRTIAMLNPLGRADDNAGDDDLGSGPLLFAFLMGARCTCCEGACTSGTSSAGSR